MIKNSVVDQYPGKSTCSTDAAGRLAGVDTAAHGSGCSPVKTFPAILSSRLYNRVHFCCWRLILSLCTEPKPAKFLLRHVCLPETPVPKHDSDWLDRNYLCPGGSVKHMDTIGCAETAAALAQCVRETSSKLPNLAAMTIARLSIHHRGWR